MGLSPIPRAPDSFEAGYFQLTSPPTVFGDNYPKVALTSSNGESPEEITIEQVEVFVAP